ncbi:MAG: DUF5995 family protein [Gaiellaceae bacterium]
MPSPSSVAEVVAQMEGIVTPLPRSDGVACFTRLYLAVTKGVQQRLAGVAFADPGFLARLDVAFADLFFTAFQAFSRDPARAPRAWTPLFEARSSRGIAPLQFAFAGSIADVVAMWNISRARDAAWTNAEALWALRDSTDLSRNYLATLDRMVGLAGRGLLVPADTALQRLARRFGFA